VSSTFLHNPRCSKSRQALQLLQDQAVDVEVIEYLKTPPDFASLDSILRMLTLQPRELMRKNEDEYTQLHLDNTELSREQLIQAMVDHPILIERPILIKDGKAAVGRPPEQILDIL